MRRAVLLASALAAQVSSSAAYFMSQDEGSQLLDSLNSYEVLSETHSGRGLSTKQDTHEHTLSVFGNEYVLDLERHEVFTKNFKHFLVDDYGNEEEDQDVERDCLYRGKVRGYEKSHVVYSLCGGSAHGKIYTGGDEIHIQTMTAPGGHRRLTAGSTATVAFRSEDIKSEHLKRRICPGSVHRRLDSKDLGDGVEKLLEPRALAGADDPADNRYLQLLLVNSASRQRRRGFAVISHTTLILGLVQKLYDSMYEEYGGKAIIIRVSGMYTFVGSDDPSLGIDIDDEKYEVGSLLTKFDSYIDSKGNDAPQHDLRHMLVGTDFYYEVNGQSDDTVIGLAHNPAACYGGAKAGVTQSTSVFNQDIANTMAHEVGHNLGMNHDTEDNPFHTPSNPCNKPGIAEVMGPSAAPGETLYWSTCSDQALQETISSTNCMENDGSFVDGNPVCGNGIVEEGEECDCPFGDCTNYDPCCTSSCTLTSGAVCSALDTCCLDTCQLAPQGQKCREAKSNACDVEEVCDGESSSCPVDVRETDGKECVDSTSQNVQGVGGDPQGGACFRGECIGRNAQCTQLGSEYETAYTKECGALSCVSDTQRTTSGSLYFASGTPCCEDEESGDCEKLFDLGSIDPLERRLCFADDNGFSCLKVKDIPLEGANNCTNGVQDVEETDVDCGGPTCYPCKYPQQCLTDFDCAFPSECNITAVDTGTNNTAEIVYGTCTFVEKPKDYCGEWCPQFLRDIVNWAIANPVIAGLIGFAAFLFLCLFFAWCCYTPKPKAKKHKKLTEIPDAVAVEGGPV